MFHFCISETNLKCLITKKFLTNGNTGRGCDVSTGREIEFHSLVKMFLLTQCDMSGGMCRPIIESSRLFVISGFRRGVVEICALLGYYAASNGNPLPTFQDSLSVPSSRSPRRSPLLLGLLDP
jgi:hypothetical protein